MQYIKGFIRKIKRLFKNYHCVKQYDETDCGAACLASISKYYGLKKPLTQIRRIAGTDKEGTNALGMVRAAEELGFEAKGVRAEKEELTEELPFPLIAHVDMDGLLHYVVVYEIVDGEVIVADPSKGIVSYQWEDFYEIWTGILIFLTPTEDFTAKDEKEGFFLDFLAWY